MALRTEGCGMALKSEMISGPPHQREVPCREVGIIGCQKIEYIRVEDACLSRQRRDALIRFVPASYFWIAGR